MRVFLAALLLFFIGRLSKSAVTNGATITAAVENSTAVTSEGSHATTSAVVTNGTNALITNGTTSAKTNGTIAEKAHDTNALITNGTTALITNGTTAEKAHDTNAFIANGTTVLITNGTTSAITNGSTISIVTNATTNSPKAAINDTGQPGQDKVDSKTSDEPVGEDSDKSKQAVKPEAKSFPVFCDPNQLEVEISSGKDAGGQRKTLYARVLKDWKKMTPEENKIVSLAMMKNNMTRIPGNDTLGKIPAECVLQYKLTGITLEQTEVLISAKLRLDIAWHAMTYLDKTSKTQLFSDLLHDNILPNFMREALGRSFGGATVARKIHGSENMDCHWLRGAITDDHINIASFLAIAKSLKERRCKFRHIRDLTALCRKAEELLRYDTLHFMILASEGILPYCGMKECRAIFTNKRLMELISDPKNVERFGFRDIQWRQPTPSCESPKTQDRTIPGGSHCAVYLAGKLSKQFTEMTAEVWKSLGGLQPYYDMAKLQKQMKSPTETPCLDYNLYELYQWRGAYLGVKCQWTVSSCTLQDPLKNLSKTISNATAADVKKVSGYLPFLQEDVIKACANATLCSKEVRSGYINVLPYGKHQPICQKCSDDLFDLVKVTPLCNGGVDRLARGVLVSNLLNETAKLPACLNDTKCRTLLGTYPLNLKFLLMSQINLTENIGKILQDYGLSSSVLSSDVCGERNDSETLAPGSQLTLSQCSCVRDHLLTAKPVSKRTHSDLSKHRYIVPCLTPDMIKNIHVDADSLAAILCAPDTVRMLPQETKKAIADKLIQKLDPTVWPHNSIITRDRLLIMGPCLTQLPLKYIEKTSPDVCKEICRHYRKQVDPRYTVCEPVTDFHDVVKLCKGCVQASPSQPLTSSDIEDLGLLSCGLLADDMAAISRDAFFSSIDIFARCPVMSRKTEAVFFSRIVKSENFGHFSKWTSLAVIRLGRTITYLNKTSLEAIPKYTREQAISKVNKIIWSDLLCFGKMFGGRVTSFIKERNRVVDLAFKKPQELRFRRFDDPKSRLCHNGMDTVPHLQKISNDISPNELNGISKENFRSCLSTLGAYQGWSPEQKNTLLIRVNADIAEVCKLSPTEVVAAQHIMTAVTRSHLRCFDLNDIDVLTTLGNPAMNWAAEKLVHLADRYKVLNQDLKLSALTPEDLVKLGIVLCGFSRWDIIKINSSNYRKASVVIGTYLACPIEKMETLLAVATSEPAYGPVEKWTCSTISDVGVLMAAVDGEKLTSLGGNLNCISARVIPLIPPSAIKAIPETVMALMPPKFINSLTPAQLEVAQLTEDQLIMTTAFTGIPIAEPRKTTASAGYLGICLKTMLLICITSHLTVQTL